MKALSFFYQDTCGVSSDELTTTFQALVQHLQIFKTKLKSPTYETKESFIKLPFDGEILKSIEGLKEKIATDKVKYIFHVGIGGSNLGARAVYDGIFGTYDELEQERFPKIVFLDSINDLYLTKVKNLLNNVSSFDETLFIVVSESGTTKETIFNYTVLVENFPLIKKRTIFVTERGEKLEEYALSIEALVLKMPIGGRFCLFSQSNLTPLFFCGIDVKAFIKGACEITQSLLSENINENISAVLAISTFLNSQKGINIINNFYFDSSLETMGKWTRQLVAESIGKNGRGLTPIVSIGSVDLHSIYQLFAGGPKDKFTNFVNYKKEGSLNKFTNSSILSILNGRTAIEIENAIFNGVLDSYKNLNLPFTTTLLEFHDEFSLGAFMQTKMVETAFLAYLLGVNAYDQPDVERYKKITDEYLAKS